MAQVINPAVQITGLSDSGTADTTGSWNTAVDVTTYGVPSTASAVLLMIDMPASAKWWGFRDPDSTTSKAGFYADCASGSDSTVIVPCRSGTVDLYREAGGPTFWVAGYWEAGAVEWLTAGNELTRQTTSATNFTWDFTADEPDATGVIICQSAERSESSPSISIASNGAPTAWSNTIRWNANQPSDAGIFILPLDSGEACYVDTAFSSTITYNIVGFIKQPITFLYDDNSGPTESPGTTGTWSAGTYDYGSQGGIGCMIRSYDLLVGFMAAADTSDPFPAAGTAMSQMTTVMHTVKSDGTWNYILETGAPTYQIYWFMGPSPMVYINDAATIDAGAVPQGYPGKTNWSDTSIDVQQAPDTTGLTGQLYAIVETATGAVASRAITVGGGITDVNFSGHRGIMRGAMRGVG